MHVCPNGTVDLVGTGFDIWSGGGNPIDDAGATSWLRTTAPITGGEDFTIRFAIWDASDQLSDSTVILDNFQWIIDPTQLGTQN